MAEYTFSLFLISLVALITGLFSIHNLPKLWQRTIVLVLFIGAILINAVVLTQSLGNPKPLQIEVLKKEKMIVAEAYFREGIAIYVWVIDPVVQRPVYYSLPWDKNLAQMLQQMLRDSQGNGNQVMFDPNNQNGSGSSLDNREPLFYTIPGHDMPPKQYR